jgi:hypothetical protein
MLAAIVQNCSDFIGIATLAGRPVFVNAAGRRISAPALARYRAAGGSMLVGIPTR